MALTPEELTAIADIVEGSSKLSAGVTTDISNATVALPEIKDITIDSVVGDSGVFPILFGALSESLDEIAGNGYITRDAVAEILARVTPSIIEQSLNFELQKQSATFSTYQAKIAAQNAQAQQQLLATQIGTARAEANRAWLLADQESYNLDSILPARKRLLDEQAEQAHAATSDTRLDGTAVTGSVGKQKLLFDQQITSYQNSDLLKFMQNVHINTWTVRKSTDVGVAVPDALSDGNFNDAAETLANKLGIPISV